MPSEVLSAYNLAGLTLHSEVRFPELGPALADAPADWTFRLSSAPPRPPANGWFHHWHGTNGRPWLSFGRDRHGYVLRFARLATFRVMPDRQTIVCDGASRIPRNTVRHLFLNQVFPLVMSRGSRVVLHASAIGDASGVVGFVGDAGAGKSTISAALSGVNRRFIGDDALVIADAGHQPAVVPMYPSVRLWPDSLGRLFGTSINHPAVSHYTNKRLVALPEPWCPGAEALTLRVLCLLAPHRRGRQPQGARVREVSPRDAVIRLTSHVFQLDVDDPAQMKADFERLAAIADRVPVVELSYRWGLAGVRETAAAAFEALSRFQ